MGSEVEGVLWIWNWLPWGGITHFICRRKKMTRNMKGEGFSGLNSQTGQMPCISEHAWRFGFANRHPLWGFRKDRRRVRALSGGHPPGPFRKETLVRPSVYHNLRDRDVWLFLFFFSQRTRWDYLVTFSFRNLYSFCLFACSQFSFCFLSYFQTCLGSRCPVRTSPYPSLGTYSARLWSQRT